MTQREFDESTDRGSCVSVACQFWRFACQEANETVLLRLSLGEKRFVDVACQEANEPVSLRLSLGTKRR